MPNYELMLIYEYVLVDSHFICSFASVIKKTAPGDSSLSLERNIARRRRKDHFHYRLVVVRCPVLPVNLQMPANAVITTHSKRRKKTLGIFITFFPSFIRSRSMQAFVFLIPRALSIARRKFPYRARRMRPISLWVFRKKA